MEVGVGGMVSRLFRHGKKRGHLDGGTNECKCVEQSQNEPPGFEGLSSRERKPHASLQGERLTTSDLRTKQSLFLRTKQSS